MAELCPGEVEDSIRRSHLVAGSSWSGGNSLDEGQGLGWKVSVSGGESLVRSLHSEEEGTGLWGGTEKVSSPFPGM